MSGVDQFSPIVAGLGVAALRAVNELSGGSAPVFRLDLEDGTVLVLKTYDRPESGPHREAYASELLAGVDIPHPRYLLIEEGMARLPYRFAVTTYVTGARGSAFMGSGELFKGIGRLARQLHGVRLPGFGDLRKCEYQTNAIYVRGLIDHALAKFLHYGADPTLARTLRTLFDRDFATVVLDTDRAAFAHDDLHPGNILVTETERGPSITGLIDFGNARASAPVMDLAKTVFICEHEKLGSGVDVLAGYGLIDHPDPEKALQFYTTLHRVIMWWWLRHIGVLATADAEVDVMTALRASAANA